MSQSDFATIVTYPDDFSKEEIVELAKAAGYKVQDVITQKEVIKSEYGIGVGKAQEMQQLVAQNKSRTLIIDESLTSSQAFKLAGKTQVNVIDRERLILDIFAKRANTTEAKLQVQLADLKYQIPRLKETVRLTLNSEQAGFSGSGEIEVDIKFRALKRRMGFIKEKLERTRTKNELHTRERKKLGMPFVSLAGYTSSGKTTVFNKLATESKEESPKLFTTLSTTTRAVTFPNSKKVLLSDTVGFISRLPTYLVESFKSTLDELRYADLVLLMLDASENSQSVSLKLRSCIDTLSDIGVDSQKILLVLNKIDLLGPGGSRGLDTDPMFADFETAKVSATRGDGMHKLRNRILELTGGLNGPQRL